MNSRLDEIEFEYPSLAARLAKKIFVNPLANYLPASLLRKLLHSAQSELAKSNWADPGGWRSMVISYDANPDKAVDRLLVTGGTIPMALRNRKRLASRLIADMIDRVENPPAHVLCLGAGPGQIIIEAMTKAKHQAEATLVDINPDAFDYGRKLAHDRELSDCVRFVQGDIRDINDVPDHQTDIVKMIGICEYLPDDQIISIVRAVNRFMPVGASIVLNSISKRHGTNRFFRRVFGLNMIHRTAEQLQNLLSDAGFGDFVTFDEPLKVYKVILASKLSEAQNTPQTSKGQN